MMKSLKEDVKISPEDCPPAPDSPQQLNNTSQLWPWLWTSTSQVTTKPGF